MRTVPVAVTPFARDCSPPGTASPAGTRWNRLAARGTRAFVVTAILGCVGCSGSASLSMVPMSNATIDPTSPLVVNLSASECYFWIDEPAQQLHIALTHGAPNWLSDADAPALDVSLVLDGLPANNARDYRINRRTLRGTANEDHHHVRFASQRGVAAVWFEGPTRLRGRMRVHTKYQRYNLLFGWHDSQPVLLLGEFTAIRDQQRCEAIVARTEQGGMARDLAPPDQSGPRPISGPPVSPDE